MSKKRERSLIGEQCYACTQPATSWEHAPPRGFYPRRHEVLNAPKGKDFRSNLIDVPACDEHNAKKSQDDNFVQVAITVFSALHHRHFQQVTQQPFVLQRRERIHQQPRLRKALIETAKLVATPAGPMVAIKPEVPTIRRVVEFTARALYYHERARKQRWPGKCVVISPRFVLDDLSPDPETENAIKILSAFAEFQQREYPGFEWRGPHPEIFAYQLLDLEGRLAMRMVFYAAFEFLALSRPEETESEPMLP